MSDQNTNTIPSLAELATKQVWQHWLDNGLADELVEVLIAHPDGRPALKRAWSRPHPNPYYEFTQPPKRGRFRPVHLMVIKANPFQEAMQPPSG